MALQATTVSEKCVHCGLCVEVCPQRCIKIEDRDLAADGSLEIRAAKPLFTSIPACTAAGAPRFALWVPYLPEALSAGEFSRDDNVCQACRTCVHTCPANALFNKEWGPGEIVLKVTHRKDACIYCGACAQACPVRAISVRKTAIIPEMKGKKAFEKKLFDPAPWPTLTSMLQTDEDGCLGCGNCVIACPVNAPFSSIPIWLQATSMSWMTNRYWKY